MPPAITRDSLNGSCHLHQPLGYFCLQATTVLPSAANQIDRPIWQQIFSPASTSTFTSTSATFIVILTISASSFQMSLFERPDKSSADQNIEQNKFKYKINKTKIQFTSLHKNDLPTSLVVSFHLPPLLLLLPQLLLLPLPLPLLLLYCYF